MDAGSGAGAGAAAGAGAGVTAGTGAGVESGAGAANSGVQFTPLGRGGLFTADDVRAACKPPGHIVLPPTGLVASEVFNARYPNGQLKPLRHSLVGFPKGTTFDAQAADTCAAGDSDFRARGMSACPASSKIGYGHATAVTTL